MKILKSLKYITIMCIGLKYVNHKSYIVSWQNCLISYILVYARIFPSGESFELSTDLLAFCGRWGYQ